MDPTKPSPLPSFDTVADRFIALGALNSPAELHGMLCGHFCGGGRYATEQWLSAASEFLDTAHAFDAEMNTLLQQLYGATLAQFNDTEFGLQLMLPDDDVELEQRIEALGQWCHGFLSGFGASGISGDTQLSTETADVLRDFAAFVQIDPMDSQDEESETDFMEIVEYVRVAALTVFMEVGVKAGGKRESGPQPMLH